MQESIESSSDAAGRADPALEMRTWVNDTQKRILLRAHRHPPEPDGYLLAAYSAWIDNWTSTNWASLPQDELSTPFELNGTLVPDSLYGLLSVDNSVSLPENGTVAECKNGILAVFEDSACEVIRRVMKVLRGYGVYVLSTKVDLIEKSASIKCHTDRPVMQVNALMGNRAIRDVLPRRARILINTCVEEDRRTDDYLPKLTRPAQQTVSREFFYEDGCMVKNEPECWSAGTKYETGDILSIAGLRFSYETSSRHSREDERRDKIGTPFQPGERASWHAARNRQSPVRR